MARARRTLYPILVRDSLESKPLTTLLTCIWRLFGDNREKPSFSGIKYIRQLSSYFGRSQTFNALSPEERVGWLSRLLTDISVNHRYYISQLAMYVPSDHPALRDCNAQTVIAVEQKSATCMLLAFAGGPGFGFLANMFAELAPTTTKCLRTHLQRQIYQTLRPADKASLAVSVGAVFRAFAAEFTDRTPETLRSIVTTPWPLSMDDERAYHLPPWCLPESYFEVQWRSSVINCVEDSLRPRPKKAPPLLPLFPAKLPLPMPDNVVSLRDLKRQRSQSISQRLAAPVTPRWKFCLQTAVHRVCSLSQKHVLAFDGPDEHFVPFGDKASIQPFEFIKPSQLASDVTQTLP